jgi:hypothetical protein
MPDKRKGTALHSEYGYNPKIDKGLIHHVALPFSDTEFASMCIINESTPLSCGNDGILIITFNKTNKHKSRSFVLFESCMF